MGEVHIHFILNQEMIISIIGLILLVTLITGIAYTAQIYYSPSPPGKTYFSVVVGVSFSILGIIALSLAFIILGKFEWILFAPLIIFALTGGSMIVGQILKARNQDKDVRTQKPKIPV